MKNGVESLEARNRARVERRLELGHGAKCCECDAELTADAPMYAMSKDRLLCADCAEGLHMGGSGCSWCGTKVLINYAARNLRSCTRYCMIRNSKNKAASGVNCHHCADLFTPKRSTAKFCSTACRVASSRTDGSKWAVVSAGEFRSGCYGPFTSKAGADELAEGMAAYDAKRREGRDHYPVYTYSVEPYTPPPPPPPPKTMEELIAEGRALAGR